MAYTACYKCEDRKVCCHQTCERYLEEKRENDARKAEISKRKKMEQDANFFKRDAMQKIKRKLR